MSSEKRSPAHQGRTPDPWVCKANGLTFPQVTLWPETARNPTRLWVFLLMSCCIWFPDI